MFLNIQRPFYRCLYSVQDQKVVKNETLVDRLFSRSQIEGEEHNAKNADINHEMIQNMRYDFAEALCEVKNKKKAEIEIQMESDRQRNEKQAKEYYTSIINNQNKYIRDWESKIYDSIDKKKARSLEGAIRLARARIQELEKEKAERLAQINEALQIEISESIVSLNLINII